MMVKTILRWSGLPLTAGALLLGAAIVSAAFQAPNQLPAPLMSTLLLVASILIMLTLPAMYVRQAEAAGWLGLMGYVLLQVGMFPIVVYAGAPLFYLQIQATPVPSTGALVLGTALMVGLPLTAIATLRAGVYPRWSGILLLAAGVGMVFAFVVADALPPTAGQLGSVIWGILFASGFAWIGIALWTGWSQSSTRLPAAASM
jgi:hypothetical protein